MRLKDQVAVVSGASSGIGRAAALKFAEEGANLAVGSRNKSALDELAAACEEKGVKALAVELDVTEEESVAAFAAEVGATFGEVDLLLNNAGIGRRGLVTEMDTKQWDLVMNVNVRGSFLVLKHFLPLMQDGPRLRNVLVTASVAGTQGVPGLSAYAASKWAVRGLSQSAALEVADRGVRVVSVNPGYVATPMTEGAPAKRSAMMSPEDVAETLVRIATLPPSVQVDDLNLWPQRLYTE